MNEITNDSWKAALATYESLEEHGWRHIKRFRQLVEEISRSPYAAGLNAVTSQGTLIISPYSCFPDWLKGRHVRLQQLNDGRVCIDRFWGEHDRRSNETWTLPFGEVYEKVGLLLADL